MHASRKQAIKRKCIQIAAFGLSNAHLANIAGGKLYTGPWKQFCNPGLNCYSCPAASLACPIGALAAVGGTAGTLILAVTVTLACLKTSVGLVTSCAETFVEMFPRGPGYKAWALLFSGLSFLIANVGLTAILDWSLPVLMLLYPLAITLILLGLAGKWFQHDPLVYRLVTGLTLVAALFDFFGALPTGAAASLHLEGAIGFAKAFLPLYGLGLGWVCPAAAGLALAMALRWMRSKKAAP